MPFLARDAQSTFWAGRFRTDSIAGGVGAGHSLPSLDDSGSDDMHSSLQLLLSEKENVGDSVPDLLHHVHFGLPVVYSVSFFYTILEYIIQPSFGVLFH